MDDAPPIGRSRRPVPWPTLLVALGPILAGCDAEAPRLASPSPARPAIASEVPRASDPGVRSSQPSDQPDGRLAYSAMTASGEALFQLDLTTRAVTRLTHSDGPDIEPDVRADGERIVYRHLPGPAGSDSDIWLVDADGTGARNLTRNSAVENTSPRWSPNGKLIAFASKRGGQGTHVWTMDADGRNLRRVTTAWSSSPGWSNDGRRLVYAGPPDGEGSDDLWITPLEGTVPLHLTTTPTTEENDPSWSPDGRWIAYQRLMGDHIEVWLVRPDGSDAHAALPGIGAAAPTWTGDNRLLIADDVITIVDPATGASAPLLAAAGIRGASFLAWSP